MKGELAQRLREAKPNSTVGRREVSAETFDALGDSILMTNQHASTERTIRARIARPARVALATLLLTGLVGGVGYAGYRQQQSQRPETVGINCQLVRDELSVIAPVTGDPIADCIAHWQRTGQNIPPDLTIYQEAGFTGVSVGSKSRMPDGAQATTAPVVDVKIAELDVFVDDLLHGINYAKPCIGAAEAKVRLETVMRRIDTAMPFNVPAPEATCVKAHVAQGQIDISPVRTDIPEAEVAGTFVGDPSPAAQAERQAKYAAHDKFPQLLRPATADGQCRSVNELQQLIRDKAKEAGLTPEYVDVTHVPGTTRQCASVYSVPSGGEQLRIFG